MFSLTKFPSLIFVFLVVLILTLLLDEIHACPTTLCESYIELYKLYTKSYFWKNTEVLFCYTTKIKIFFYFLNKNTIFSHDKNIQTLNV